ncbi:TldD/PmbA family protein [Salinivibrio kushneri]|uniref:TldD/PmbA family protein n=1 Tax=Salinivibrio kushneri TaxID=1908198 RepID=UPI0022B3255E|nr:TldD/PmbA family protein [Salinivibrio kushneri]WBA13086.1 TldD/PmbA family protein [Salinivibrio kushneri]
MSEPTIKATLSDAVDQVLSLVKQQGAQADVIANASESLSLKADQGDLSEHKVTAGQVIGVRVIKGDQVATSYSESLDSDSLASMVNAALTNASFTKAESDQQIRAEEQHIDQQDPSLLQADSTPIEDKIALALALEQDVISQPRATGAPYNGYSEQTQFQLLANTLGTRCYHSERRFSCYTAALLNHDGKQAMHLGASVSRRFADLDLAHATQLAYQTADALLEGGPVKTGSYPVIFEHDCLSELLGAFGSCFSGDAAKRGTNPWREKVGKPVADTALTITDVARLDGGMRIKAFDSEGFATADTPLIENGVLVGFLHNSATAQHFGVPHTANAGRSPKGGLDVTSRHDVIAAGQHSDADVHAGEYLELVSLQGVHSGANAISGDFSFGASGFVCREGKRVRPVRGITVAGNFYTMLNEIDAIGNTVLPNYDGAFFAPRIRFARLSIAGE